ncbi:non-homologous end joining protein Ku [Jiangella endophytica]|uniref:non-homologous end joining protein Ku n=1 Tax=Jiangella endophytica TaxID=1623398 RepID=UPI000E34766A|nr:Ku protein [Jiangella endophytica]
MARSIWSGFLSFGLVSIPVRLYSATQEHEVDFHQFERGTSDRIRYRRVNERTGDEVGYDDIVKGHDVGGGEYVIVERDELEEIAPGRSRSLEIEQFVELAETDPVHFQKSYYLGPADDDTAPSYALLRTALEKTDRAAVATFVMRGKEYLACVRASGPVLVLETMYFADEIRDPVKELGDLPRASSKGKQLGMAVDLVEAMTEPWKPERFRDTYTERVEELVEAKREGKEVVAESAPAATGATDLLTALQESVAAARKKTAPRKTARKKSAA